MNLGLTVDIIFPHDVESSLSESEGRALAELAAGKTVLELGAWQGRSTICLAQTAHKVYSVDWHQGDDHSGNGSTLSAYWENLGRYGLTREVVTIIGRFEDVLPVLRPHTFDLIFLDGFHSYEQVKADIARLRPLVADRSMVALHDYGVEASSMGGGAFGVTQAAQETLGTPDRIVGSLAIFTDEGV